MSEAKISREEAQAEIDGLLVAEILRDFGTNFLGVYPDNVLAQGVGPNQSMIGLAIKRGHLATIAQAAELTRLRARIEAADKLAQQSEDYIDGLTTSEHARAALSAYEETRK